MARTIANYGKRKLSSWKTDLKTRAAFFLIFVLALVSSVDAQELIGRLRDEYIYEVSQDKVLHPRLKLLLERLGADQIKKLFPDKVSSRILQGMVLINVKEAGSADEVMKILNRSGFFMYVEKTGDEENKLLHTPSDPFAHPVTGKQHYLQQVNAYKAWDITKGDTTTTICIIDNGVEFNHPELTGKLSFNTGDPQDGIDNDDDGYIDNYRGWDFANGDNYPEDSTGSSGHGTEVTGIAAASTDNGLGIASMGYHCRFVPYKVFGANRVSAYTQYYAIAFAASKGCKIINLSWGISSSQANWQQYQQDLINYAALEADAVLVGATFPEEGEHYTYPGNYDNVLSVLAVASDDVKSYPQSTHHWIDMSVPGVDMISTGLNKGYVSQTGISLGLPLVSGTAALIRSKYPQLNATQVRELLRVTSRNIDTVKTNKEFREKLGHGCLDAFAALTDTVSPAIRVRSYLVQKWNGDTVTIRLGMKNYLRKAGDLKLTFRAVSDGLIVTDSLARIGSVTFPDSAVSDSGDIRFRILPYAEGNDYELVRIGISDSTTHYSDYQYIYISKYVEEPVITSSPALAGSGVHNKVYPNPCRDYFVIQGSEADQVTVTDIAGAVLYSAFSEHGLLTFDMKSHPSGVYFIQTKRAHGVFTEKIIKE